MVTRTYEIRIAKRDKLGNPIPNKYLEYATDDAGRLAAWYERHAWRKPFKKKKRKKNVKSKSKAQEGSSERKPVRKEHQGKNNKRKIPRRTPGQGMAIQR